MGVDYCLLTRQLDAITKDVSVSVSNYANAAALLFHALPGVSWAGFYFLKDSFLYLGPFQGKPACTRIGLGAGVCGTAALRKEALIVEDVRLFPGHIACDPASKSELVIPLIWEERVLGVLDLDAPVVSRFSAEDRDGLLPFCDLLVRRAHFIMP